MSRKRSAAHNSFSDSSSRHGFQPTQHASEGAYSEGGWTGQHYGDSRYTDHSVGLQTGQEHNTFVPSIHSSEGQWSQQQQQQQQPWQFFNRQAINAAFQPLAQSQLYNEPTSQQWSWSQQYPQYGHINPTFLPQQPVASTQYPTQQPANSANSGYGGSYTSSGAAYNGGQSAGNGYNYQTNQISLANSQAYQQSANVHQPANLIHPGYYQYQNFTQQLQPQAQTFQYKGTGRSEAVPTPERYGNRSAQFHSFMDPPLTATTGGNPRLYLLPEPKPSPEYLERANLPPRRLTSPKKLLIVLDLNGTLLVRSNRGSSYTPRPHVNEFLAYCLEHHKLVVWSSARPHNVNPMVAQLFNKKRHAKLVEIWSREHLRLGEHYNEKVQVYKQLSWLWEDAKVQASFPAEPPGLFRIEDGWKKPPPPAKWDQSNTVLLDDTTDKAASEPYNLIRVDEFTKENKDDGDDVLGRVIAYLEDLKWEADVSAAMRVKPFVNGEVVDGDPEQLERPPSA
jgi:hypothetical protein